MRDFFVRAKTGDLHAVHSALADELLAPGRRRDFLFSPVRLPDGGLGAWVRISAPDETRGRLVDIPQAGEEADFIFRAFAAGKGRDGKKRAFPAAPGWSGRASGTAFPLSAPRSLWKTPPFTAPPECSDSMSPSFPDA